MVLFYHSLFHLLYLYHRSRVRSFSCFAFLLEIFVPASTAQDGVIPHYSAQFFFDIDYWI
jgi:hypothetical protein